MSKVDNFLKGKIGESIGGKYLKTKKYKIIETNFSCKIGEVDIIALDRDTIVFVEVKARCSNEYGNPSQAVGFYKKRKISKVALYYLQRYDLFHKNVRFDVIELWFNDNDQMEINHIVNAFEIIM